MLSKYRAKSFAAGRRGNVCGMKNGKPQTEHGNDSHVAAGAEALRCRSRWLLWAVVPGKE